MSTTTTTTAMVETAINDLKKFNRYHDGPFDVTHTIVIEYDGRTFIPGNRYEVHARTGHAGGAFWRNGGHDLFHAETLEKAVDKIASTFGLCNVLILLV